MVLWIGLGGIMGGLSRYYIGKWISVKASRSFPLGTLVINISGSLLLGILFAMQMQQQLTEWLWMMLGIGFCGAYTTFSTFGYETVQLMEKKRFAAAAAYVIASVCCGIPAAWIGMALMV